MYENWTFREMRTYIDDRYHDKAWLQWWLLTSDSRDWNLPEFDVRCLKARANFLLERF